MHRILDKKKSLVICQDSSKLGIVSRFIKTNSDRPFSIFKEFETLPYDHFSPHLDNLSNRIETLSKTYQSPINELYIPRASRTRTRKRLKTHVLYERKRKRLKTKCFTSENEKKT